MVLMLVRIWKMGARTESEVTVPFEWHVGTVCGDPIMRGEIESR